MMQLSNDELHRRAEKIIVDLAGMPFRAGIGKGKAKIGGGTLPRSTIESVTIDFATDEPAAFAARLRRGTPPVIGYISGGKFKLDLRTVFRRQDEELVTALRRAAQSS
jgi:L-seryl-tRNA(Ser) seleniumtransferase